MMKKFWQLFFLSAIIIVLYITIAPYFYKIFFPKYLDSLPYSQILIFSLLAVPASLVGTIFEAKAMKRSVYFLKTASLFRLALYAVLIPLYGIWGLVIARLGMIVLKSALILLLFRRL